MNIRIVWGESEGKTELSAFDRALAEAGIHNYNLVCLSSIVPVGAVVVESKKVENVGSVGDLLSVVMAHNTSSEAGSWISSGLGWIQAKEGGIFYELSIDDRAAHCKRVMVEGLKDMMFTRDWDWNTDVQTRVVEHRVGAASAVVVAAVFARL